MEAERRSFVLQWGSVTMRRRTMMALLLGVIMSKMPCVDAFGSAANRRCIILSPHKTSWGTTENTGSDLILSRAVFQTRKIFPSPVGRWTKPLCSVPPSSSEFSSSSQTDIRGEAVGSTEESVLQVGPGADDASILAGEELNSDIYDKAIEQTLFFIGAATLFGLGLLSTVGSKTAEEFFAGYLVELSLSVDNLFVFLLLFDYFKVPLPHQNRVLNWGIYGAIVTRATMIGLGAAALDNFHAVILIFAAILIYSSASALLPSAADDDGEEDMSDNKVVQFSRTLFDSVDYFDGDRFFTIVDGVKKATPLFICMIALEISDVVFAVDSIPAVFGVTENPLIVFTSNIFAILGLRSLYTILSKAASDLEYLEPAVAIVLGFIGCKMVAEYFGFVIPTSIALGVVVTLLSGGVGLSITSKQQQQQQQQYEE